jgi:SsrA-binding protein
MGQKRKSKGGTSGAADPARKTVVVNRKARHTYEILEQFECGMVLRGTEVKALRAHLISLEEAFGRIGDDEAIYLVGARIEPYSHASIGNHEPTRRRKLLIRRAELRKLKAKVTQKGLTLVPLQVYFNARGIAKLELALCRGKRLHDKRQELKKRESDREMRRVM